MKVKAWILRKLFIMKKEVTLGDIIILILAVSVCTLIFVGIVALVVYG